MSADYKPSTGSVKYEELSSTYTLGPGALGQLKLAEPPPRPVGYWVMPGGTASWQTKFAAYARPRWLTRVAMRHVFGWQYEDNAK